MMYYVHLCELGLYDAPRHCFWLYVLGLMYILTRFVEHFSNREYVLALRLYCALL